VIEPSLAQFTHDLAFLDHKAFYPSFADENEIPQMNSEKPRGIPPQNLEQGEPPLMRIPHDSK